MSKPMKTQQKQTTQQQVLDTEALEWLTLMQSENPGQDVLQAFDEWLAQSAAHREAYLEAELLADDLVALGSSEHAAEIRQATQVTDSVEVNNAAAQANQSKTKKTIHTQ